MVVCSKCGMANADGSSACAQCGAPLGMAGGPQMGGYPGGSQMGGYPGSSMGGYAPRAAVMHVPSLVFAVLGLLSVFLPFLTVEVFGFSQSVSLWDLAKEGGSADVYLLIGLFVVAIALIVLKKPLGSLIVSVVIMVLLIIEIVGAASKISEAMGGASSMGIDLGDMSQFIKPGIGAIFLVVGAIGLLIAAIINNAKNR